MKRTVVPMRMTWGRHQRGSAPMFIIVRTGAYVGRESVFSTVVYISVQTNVARNAFRVATTISQYITSVLPNLLDQLTVTNLGFG